METRTIRWTLVLLGRILLQHPPRAAPRREVLVRPLNRHPCLSRVRASISLCIPPLLAASDGYRPSLVPRSSEGKSK
ncbi:hypothetical protein C8F04DRAFT_1101553 [Mycena alexandri]|uniref:Secreted protein n=1 Tax=Mycena alexandri TaxID=1745969 RepID=A0AAD6SVI5_9AGAR|nr:hypothetical protein C8F04DRAFT_1101553 [Mycena alexandri]